MAKRIASSKAGKSKRKSSRKKKKQKDQAKAASSQKASAPAKASTKRYGKEDLPTGHVFGAIRAGSVHGQIAAMLVEGKHTRQEIIDRVKLPENSRANSAAGPVAVWLSTSDKLSGDGKHGTMAAVMGHMILKDHKDRLLLIQVREAIPRIQERVKRLGGELGVGFNVSKITNKHTPVGGLKEHKIPKAK
jgi:hypothetical protein